MVVTEAEIVQHAKRLGTDVNVKQICRVVVDFITIRGEQCKPSPIEIVCRLASFAAHCLCIEPEDFLLPMSGKPTSGKKKIIAENGTINQLSRSDFAKIKKTFLFMEKFFNSAHNTHDTIGTQKMSWDTFRKQLQLCRQLFALHARLHPKHPQQISREDLKLQMFHIIGKHKSFKQFRDTTTKLLLAVEDPKVRVVIEPDGQTKITHLPCPPVSPCVRVPTGRVASPKRKARTQKQAEQEQQQKQQKQRKTEMHAELPDDTVIQFPKRKHLDECLQQSNASLFQQNAHQAICFEELMPGKRGKRGKSWKTDLSIMLAHWTSPIAVMGFCAFLRSRKMFHGEIETDPSTQEHLQVFDCALRNGKKCHLLPSTGSSLDGNLIRVMHSDDEHFPPLREMLNVDPVFIIKTMHDLKAKGDRAISFNDERNTVSFSCGFGNHAYSNNSINPEQDDIAATHPAMTHVTGSNKDTHDALCEAIGGVADACTEFMDRHCNMDVEKNYHDQTRCKMFGAKFARAMKARRSRCEAATVGLTRLGIVDSFDKLSKLHRHDDGPNDDAPGCDITCVHWEIIVLWEMVGGKLEMVAYRIAFIFYSRIKCRTSCERNGYMAAVREKCEKWRREKVDCNTMKAEDLSPGTWNFGNFPVSDTLWTHSMADPNAHCSIMVWAIEFLSGQFQLPRRRRLQLLYLAMRSVSGITFALVVMEWSLGGSLPLSTKMNGDVNGPNFLRRYAETVKEKGKNPNNALYTRMQVPQESDGGWTGEKRSDDKKIDQMIQELDQILANANSPDYSHEDIVKQCIEKLHGIGPMTSLSFYALATQLGFINSEHGKRESLRANVAPDSPLRKELVQNDCKQEDVPKALKRLAQPLEVTEQTMENIGCKTFRRRAHVKDCFHQSQFLYNRKFVNGNVVLIRRLLNQQEWEECIPFELSSDRPTNHV
jgi:hypothetical protein